MADLYNLASHYWGGDVISLHAFSATGDIFATIPVNFLRGNGVNTWDYILDLANMLVEPDPNGPGTIETSSGSTVSFVAAPSPGDYVYKQHSALAHACINLILNRGMMWPDSPISYAAGPYYKNRLKTATTASNNSSLPSAPTPSNHSVRNNGI